MSDDRFVADSIEELLVAMATGIREAQEALSESRPFDALGRALPTYHIPYLDFEVAARMETQRQSDGRPIMRLMLTKLPNAGGSSSASQELSSKITGRFVAVPPGEGLPIPQLSVETSKDDQGNTRLIILLANSAGERLAGRQIEVNLDLDASRRLTAANGGTLTDPRAGTGLVDALIITDDAGQAITVFRVDGQEAANTVFILSARAGTTVVNVSIPAK